MTRTPGSGRFRFRLERPEQADRRQLKSVPPSIDVSALSAIG
jgi:hypothetical protein